MYERRLVAFLDILGFKSAVKRTVKDDELYCKLYDLFERYSSERHLAEVFSSFSRGDGAPMSVEDLEGLRGIYGYGLTQFSDSFVFSVSADNGAACRYFPILVAEFTFKLFQLGFLVRGGISIGLMTHKENGPVFGPAFVQAYEIESSTAFFARVVLSGEAYEYLGNLGPYGHDFVDVGYDGSKEITVASYIGGRFGHVKEYFDRELSSAREWLSVLMSRLSEDERDKCIQKYVYVESRLRDLSMTESAA